MTIGWTLLLAMHCGMHWADSQNQFTQDSITTPKWHSPYTVALYYIVIRGRFPTQPSTQGHKQGALKRPWYLLPCCKPNYNSNSHNINSNTLMAPGFSRTDTEFFMTTRQRNKTLEGCEFFYTEGFWRSPSPHPPKAETIIARVLAPDLLREMIPGASLC